MWYDVCMEEIGGEVERKGINRMKVFCYMNGAGHKYKVPSWFKHQEMVDIELSQIIELYNIGFSVFLSHRNRAEDNKQMTVIIDDRL
jgi:hypothetical protein